MKFKFFLSIISLLLTGCSFSDSHVHNPVYHVKEDATCLTKGYAEYYSCSCGKRFSDKECTKEITDVVLPALGHDLTYHATEPRSCIQEGKNEYWHCNRCDKNFSDKNAQNEITTIAKEYGNHTIQHYGAKQPTKTSEGWRDYYKCLVCEKYFLLVDEEYVEKEWKDIALELFIVSFDYSGIPDQEVVTNGKATIPSITPTKDDTLEYKFNFKYWTLNGAEYDFNTIVTKDITLKPYFEKTPIDYTITFKCDGKDDVIKSFNCETDPNTFEEPSLDEIYGYIGSWSEYSLTNLSNQISYAVYTPSPYLLTKPILEKADGYTIKFHTVEHATTYQVIDDNDYRDSVVLNASDADINGYLYYTPEVVGKHNIKVTAKADGYYERTSDVIQSLEIKEVFSYSIPTSVKFFDDRSSPVGSTYTLTMKDGSKTYVSQSTFNSTYILNQGELADFSQPEYIDDTMQKIKGLGNNIVNLSNRFTNVETYGTWWWKNSFELSALKRTMDAAWKYGMKCYVADFTILNMSCAPDTYNLIKGRLEDKEFQKVFTHPAFYGIELNDEPLPGDELTNMCNTIKNIQTIWSQNDYLKTLPSPHFHTDLCSFNTNENGENPDEPLLFPTAQDYENYLEYWVNNTGLDYLYFDYYTYTVCIYGQKEYSKTMYWYDSSKVIFDSINNIRSRHPDLIVHQTIDACNYSKRQDLSYTNVFASTLLSISEGMNGYSTFELVQGNYSYENFPLDDNRNKTNTYYWLQEANQQYRIIMGLLDGFLLKNNEISNYAQKLSDLGSPVAGYGFGVRTSTSIFENSNKNQYKMVVNFNTYSKNTTTNVKVDSGLNYYLFGHNKTITKLTGGGDNVILNNGEAILIKIS